MATIRNTTDVDIIVTENVTIRGRVDMWDRPGNLCFVRNAVYEDRPFRSTEHFGLAPWERTDICQFCETPLDTDPEMNSEVEGYCSDECWEEDSAIQAGDAAYDSMMDDRYFGEGY